MTIIGILLFFFFVCFLIAIPIGIVKGVRAHNAAKRKAILAQPGSNVVGLASPVPTVADGLSHLVFLKAVDQRTFEDWVALNPGGVSQLIRAMFHHLPANTKVALLKQLSARPTA